MSVLSCICILLDNWNNLLSFCKLDIFNMQNKTKKRENMIRKILLAMEKGANKPAY